MHGFARLTEWDVISVAQQNDGAVLITLGLDPGEQTRRWFPNEFSTRYEVRIGKQLDLTLTVTNNCTDAFTFEEALHTYFSVGDVRQVKVTGLEGTNYIDKTDALKRKPQTGPITIESETDRVYLNTQSVCVIDDPSLARRITVAKHGSNATVVWNPWIAKSKAMADFGDDEWPTMLCVETVNAGESQITLKPGETHAMIARIELE